MRATTSRATPTLTSASSSAVRISAQDLVDVGLGQAALAAEALDDAFEAVGQVVEHAAGRYRPYRAAIGREVRDVSLRKANS